MKNLCNDKTMKRYAVAYIRKSTEEQSNFSITTQKEYCQREADTKGYEIFNFFLDDGFSAKTTNRPALIELLRICGQKKNNISAVIIYKIDRLSRETADYLEIKRLLANSGVRIISCSEQIDDTPSGEFIETVMAAQAKYDNAVKAERIKACIKTRLNSGLPHGRVPIGYLNFTTPDNKHIVVKDPKTFDIIKEAWYLMATGNHTLETIAAFLNSKDIFTRKNKKQYSLTKQQVSRIFSDKTYCGYAVSKKNNLEIKSDKIPPMILEDTFYKVKSILLKRTSTPTVYQKLRPEFPLRGFILCDTCRQPLRAGFVKGRSKYYGYYFCGTHSKPNISADTIDELFIKLLREITPDDTLRILFTAEVKKRWQNKYFEFTKQQVKVQEKIDDCEKMKVMTAKKNMEGMYDDKLTKDMIAQVDIEILTLKTIQSESNLAQLDIGALVAFMNSFLEDLGKVYIQEEIEQRKRIFIGSIFPEKLIFRNNKLEPLGLSPAFKLINQLKQGHISISAEERT